MLRIATLVISLLLLARTVAACTPAAKATAGCVDINTAPRERLMDIIHIDDVRSAEIIAMRPFTSVGDLARITGIGPERLADIHAQGIVCPIA